MSHKPQFEQVVNTIIRPPFYDWQEEVSACTEQFIVIATARQIGKTFYGVWRAIEATLMGGDVWWVAPVQGIGAAGRDLMDDIFSQEPFSDAHGNPKLFTRHKQENHYRITNGFYPNGRPRIGNLWIKSADEPRKLKSRTLNYVVIDEAAEMLELSWQMIYPMLVLRGGRALILSNPHGKNWVWKLHRKGDPTNPDRDRRWRSFNFSMRANPNITDEIIEAARNDLTRNEFLAQVEGLFVDDGGIVFVGVRAAAIIYKPILPDPVPGRRYVGGLDWGQRIDYTVLTVFDDVTKQMVDLVRFTKMEYEDQIAELVKVIAAWNIRFIRVEENTGVTLINMLRREIASAGLHCVIEPFSTQTHSKVELILAWSAAIELRQTLLVNDDKLIEEHEAMESDTTANGHQRFFAPKGMHDDIVMASALGWLAANPDITERRQNFLRMPFKGLYDPTVQRTYPTWTSFGSGNELNPPTGNQEQGMIITPSQLNRLDLHHVNPYRQPRRNVALPREETYPSGARTRRRR